LSALLAYNNNQDYARIDKSKGEDSVFKVVTTGAKIANKIRKTKGKFTQKKLKKIFKDEGIDIADDLITLVDGKIGVDDALAILDLVVGTNLNNKKTKIIGVNDGKKVTSWVNKQKKGTPRGNQRQNKQFRDATRGLSEKQKTIVHRKISGKNKSYQEIKEIAGQVKNKELW
jgi:hypothetical protein